MRRLRRRSCPQDRACSTRIVLTDSRARWSIDHSTVKCHATCHESTRGVLSLSRAVDGNTPVGVQISQSMTPQFIRMVQRGLNADVIGAGGVGRGAWEPRGPGRNVELRNDGIFLRVVIGARIPTRRYSSSAGIQLDFCYSPHTYTLYFIAEHTLTHTISRSYTPPTMCPPADAPIANGSEEMVPINTDDAPHIPPPAANGESVPPPVKAHKGLYARPSDFLSNTSNWKVSRGRCDSRYTRC